MTKRISRLVVYVGALSILWAITAPSAHAYIDPGSSSYVIQIIIGAFAAGGLAIATFWRRIRLFFGRLSGKNTDSSTDEPSSRAPDAPDAQ